MPLYFGILKFNCASQAAGWSEVYPLNAASYSVAAANLGAIATARLGMLYSDVSLVGGLLSDTALKGDSFPTGIGFPQAGTYTSMSTGTGLITLALRCEAYASFLKRGARFLRGLPNGLVGAGGVYTPITLWSTAFAAYATLVTNYVSIATKIRGAVSPPFYTFESITSFVLISQLESRKVGRPFGLHRGRVLIA
jgi:hypothetical protein